MAMFIQYWKSYIQPQQEDKEYFIENSTKATASADAKINEILNAYTTGKQSKYFRIAPRRVDWIINSITHNDNFIEPTKKDYGMLNANDPYCTGTACTNQKNNSTNFNTTIADVHGVWATCPDI